MYSKNDYRNYLEHRLAESDDFLMHWGVKGMKWRHHIRKAVEPYSSLVGSTVYNVRAQDKYSDARENYEAIGENLRSGNKTWDGKDASANTKYNVKAGTRATAEGIDSHLRSISSSIPQSEKARRKKKMKETIKRAKKKAKKLTEREDFSGSKKVGKNLYITSHKTTVG